MPAWGIHPGIGEGRRVAAAGYPRRFFCPGFFPDAVCGFCQAGDLVVQTRAMTDIDFASCRVVGTVYGFSVRGCVSVLETSPFVYNAENGWTLNFFPECAFFRNGSVVGFALRWFGVGLFIDWYRSV